MGFCIFVIYVIVNNIDESNGGKEGIKCALNFESSFMQLMTKSNFPF